jgi:rhodanese-related sulfurtransferase
MRSIIAKIALLLVLSISFVSCAQSTKSKTNTIETREDVVVSLISPNELYSKLGDIQLIDVRTPEEYAKGHLKNSVNINFYDTSFTEDMNKLDKSRELYIYCRSGGRSGKASRQLEKMGFTKVYDLQGGIINWDKNNLEVIK